MEESLRLLHPFLAFVTEEIYSKLPGNCAEGALPRAKILMTSDYPEEKKERIDEAASIRFRTLQEIVRNIRALRAECGIDPQLKLKVSLYIEKNSPAEAARENSEIIEMLSGLSGLDFIDSLKEKPASSIGVVGAGFEAFLITGDSIDIDQLKKRFEKELEKNEQNASKIDSKLKNENFVKNAPPEVIEGEKEKHAEFLRHIEKLKGYLEGMR